MVTEAINPNIKVGMPGLGERLREARTGAGLSQEKLSELIGISWMTVHRWEHDSRTIRYCHLEAASLHCGVALNALVPGLATK